MTLDLYRAGTSSIHRLGAGTKLMALFVAGTILFLIDSLSSAAVALVLASMLYPVAGFDRRKIVGQLRPLWWVFLLILAVQLFLGSWKTGMLLSTRLATLLLLAGLVTLTTRSSDMIAAITRLLSALRPLGVNPAKVALAFSLTLRFVPALAQNVADVREAQKARGLERSLFATAVPVTVRTLKMADQIAEAIDARGFDG